MALQYLASIVLPEHLKLGGFDHAAVDGARGRLYVAHTSNDSLDVIHCATDTYLHSIGGLPGAAGVLVSPERGLVFTSNRAEDTIGVFDPKDEAGLFKVKVGIHPNGLAFDPGRGLLLAANVGEPDAPATYTLSMVDVTSRTMLASIPVPGRTRWAVFDLKRDAFYVNIASPASIIVVSPEDPTRILRSIAVPTAGPHGLDLNSEGGRLFCACDSKRLLVIDIETGKVLSSHFLSGSPDVIFYHPALQRLYVAVGDPGMIDVFDTQSMKKIETVVTARGAHTLALDAERSKVYAFLPQSHSAAVYADRG